MTEQKLRPIFRSWTQFFVGLGAFLGCMTIVLAGSGFYRILLTALLNFMGYQTQ